MSPYDKNLYIMGYQNRVILDDMQVLLVLQQIK